MGVRSLSVFNSQTTSFKTWWPPLLIVHQVTVHSVTCSMDPVVKTSASCLALRFYESTKVNRIRRNRFFKRHPCERGPSPLCLSAIVIWRHGSSTKPRLADRRVCTNRSSLRRIMKPRIGLYLPWNISESKFWSILSSTFVHMKKVRLFTYATLLQCEVHLTCFY